MEIGVYITFIRYKYIYTDTAWPVLNRQTRAPVSFLTLQMMADTQKSMQLLKEHPLSPAILPPAYVLHWELNPDASSKGNLCERKTMSILVALAWFDGLTEASYLYYCNLYCVSLFISSLFLAVSMVSQC